jgi:methanogenic corrinoid protein MtbC1
MRDYSEQRTGLRPWTGAGSRVDADQEVAGATPAVDEDRMARLVRTIEGEIVPRLVLARRVSPTTGISRERVIKAPDVSDVQELVRLLLAHDVPVASGYVEAVRARGATLEMVCLDLLAPAARGLGLMWEQDECDFMQVTVGLCRLHQLLREISAEFRPDDTETTSDRSVLLAPIPGEQHTFGIMLVAQFLRRAGWDVWHEFPESLAAILDLVRQNSFAVVGLSVGSDTRLDDVASMIRAIRGGSRNRSVGILVGGPVLSVNPDAAKLVGADATAVDGLQAVAQADYLCGLREAMN